MDIPTGRKNENEIGLQEDITVQGLEESQVSEIDKVLAQERMPFEIVLKGGTPWGFALNGGKSLSTPLHISKIVAGGKASESTLAEGDYILRINDVACTDVGHALDIVDTAVDTLTITVLRGHVDCASAEAHPSVLPHRSVGLHGKDLSGQRYNDDSVVYAKSKSSQREGRNMKPHKRRGDSFNVGQINSAHIQNKSGSARGHPPPPFEPQQSTDTVQSLVSDTNNRGGYNDSHRLSSPVHQKEKLANMNKRRSEGPGAHSSSSIYQRHQSQQLPSMNSSPNLTNDNVGYTERDSRLPLEASREQKHFNSSPNILNDLENGQRNLDVKYGVGVPKGSNVRQNKYGHTEIGSYAFDMYASDVNSCRLNVQHSLPAHNLQRYQPDYENIGHLGTAPLGSEKISEIDDIDEVTGRDSIPHTPDFKDCDPLRGAGLPTRDPASLKYIKVNQNHEKYPSWPVTKPSGATEQTQPINTRAQSMTDHTNTSKEFPNKQQLAYTPGLRPLAEKNSPTAERNTDDGKARNSSDPGLKSEFVYGRYGRVERRNVANTEGRFDDFYNNSKPGYPPPNMDPDGHNIGDKEYNAPSPPERDSKGVDQTELSWKLWNVKSEKTNINEPPPPGSFSADRFRSGNQTSFPSGSQTSFPSGSQTSFPSGSQTSFPSGSHVRPSDLSFNTSAGQNIGRSNANTSPLNKGSPLCSMNQKNMWTGSQSESLPYLQDRHPSFHDQKQSSSLPTWQEKGPHSPLASPNSQSQGSYSVQRLRPQSQKDQSSSPQTIQRDRSGSQYNRSSHFSKTYSSNFPNSGEGNKKTYIVKSTPYYNTSTQTDMIPYAIKVSDPSATKSKNAEIQVDGLATGTSPTIANDQTKLFEEKSIQARMSHDFENSEVDINHKKLSGKSKEQADGIFRYPSTALSTNQASPFRGIQSIQAKYATDELDEFQNKAVLSQTCHPNISDNASIMRKLSEEFYRSSLRVLSDKRSSSSSQESPKYDSTNMLPVQQAAMSETESYSSVIIHHDQRSGPFGRDDFGSLSSIADSRHDISLVFSDISSNYKNIDLVSPRGRRSLDPSFSSYNSRSHHYDPRISSGVTPGHTRELSAPVSGVNYMSSSGPHRPVASAARKVVEQTPLNHSEAPSVTSNTKSFSSDPRSSQSMSVSSSTEPSFHQVSLSAFSSSSSNISGKQVANVSGDKPGNDRLGSDSVFIGDDDKEGDDVSDYEFNRKPSMRKAYGIYDETEKLISQSRLSGTGKGAPERQAAQSSEPSKNGSSASTSRMNRYSESLGKIQEESDAVNPGNDFDNTPVINSGFGKISKSDEQGNGWKQDKLEKYLWQNEAWLKNNVDITAGSNLRRTTSEQIAFPKQNTNFKVSSYDTDSGISQRSGASRASQLSGSSFHSYENKNIQPSSDVPLVHSRIRAGDAVRLKHEGDVNTVQPQVPLRYHEPSMSRSMKDASLADSTLYESISEKPSSPESVTEVISKVNENLAKSAQRVDSIRRSNSSSSRNSSDYVDMSRERNRKETDWSRLRSSASLRYSPDHDCRSNRSSFASENLYEDISMFSPTTPRSSYADSTDRVLEPESSNASMDSGLVASPTYQNLAYLRRPPPLPPRSPSPDETPPALPPRKYRENQSSTSVEKSGTQSPPAVSQNPSMAPTLPGERNIGSDNPMNRQVKEDNQVDRTKRDFKSLMTQWENNSPREDIYTAELRKQAQKLSSNQQQPHHQQVNAIPAAYERTKTKINFSTTFKHEPMQPQEATSPVSSSSAFTANVATTSSSGFASGYGAPSPSSSSSSPSSIQSISKSHRNNSTSAALRHEGDQLSSSDYTSLPSSLHLIPHTTNVKHIPLSSAGTAGNEAAVASSSFPTRNAQSSNIQEKTSVQDPRNRSGSDGLQNKRPVFEAADVASRSTVQHRRERSSSEHDILADRRQKQQSPPQQGFQANTAKDGTSVAASKWRPGRGGAEKPPPHPQARSGQLVEIVSMKDGQLASPESEPTCEDTQGSNRSTDSEGFADESYIGHKNKSSRAIGTYKRSKSAAVLLQSAGSSGYIGDGDAESQPFQEPKLGQQTWNSESVLTHTEAAEESALGARKAEKDSSDRVGLGLEFPDDTSRSVPVRPVRSNVHGRYSVGQIHPPSTLSTSPVSQNSNSAAASSPASVNFFAAKPFVADQRSSGDRRESPRRVPPSLAGPSYNPISSTSRGTVQDLTHPTNSQQKPGASGEGRHFNNTVLFQKTSPKKSDLSDSNNQWNVHNNNNHAITSSHSSSHDGAIQSNPDDNGLPRDTSTFTQRDYQRRESAPVKPTDTPTGSEKRLDVPPLGDTSRRRSDSSLNPTQRPALAGYDVPISHSRQPSQEELECDEKAKQLVQELENKEQRLSDVLRLDSNKKRIQYMDGLFSDSPEPASPGDRSAFNQETRRSVKNRSPQHTSDNFIDKLETSKRSSLPKEYWMSPSKALLEMELRKNEEVSRDLTKDINDSSMLMKHKEELMEKLHKKLEVLREEKVSLQQEISDNNSLGKQVCQIVDAKCQNHNERDKFKTYIDDLEKIVRLLLNLSGQLARAENAVQALGPKVDSKLKKLTIDKRERLFAKHEEAKFLKEDIDKRSEQLLGVLRERLTEREFMDYTHFIKMKSKLTIELQELDDKITLGDEQILELKKSIPDQGTS